MARPTGRPFRIRGSPGTGRDGGRAIWSSMAMAPDAMPCIQHDAPPRRVVLVVEREVGRAGLKAEAAVHAEFRAGQREGRSGGPRLLHATASPKMPGFRMCFRVELLLHPSRERVLQGPFEIDSRVSLARASPMAGPGRRIGRDASAEPSDQPPGMPRRTSRFLRFESAPRFHRLADGASADTRAPASPIRLHASGAYGPRSKAARRSCACRIAPRRARPSTSRPPSGAHEGER